MSFKTGSPGNWSTCSFPWFPCRKPGFPCGFPHVSFWKPGVSTYFPPGFHVGNPRFPPGFHAREARKPERRAFPFGGNHLESSSFPSGNKGKTWW